MSEFVEERCNAAPVGGLFGCNSEILFFIILFLLLFCNGTLGYGYGGYGCK